MKRRICVAWCVVGILLLGFVAFSRFLAGELATKMNEHRLAQSVNQIREGQEYVIVRDADLVHLLAADPACVENLRFIYLEPPDGLDERYRRLSELSNVSEVHCGYFEVTLEALQYLKAMPSLEELSFHSNRLTDGSIEALAEIEGLKRLSFSGVVISRQALAKLKKLRPDLTITEELRSKNLNRRSLGETKLLSRKRL